MVATLLVVILVVAASVVTYEAYRPGGYANTSSGPHYPAPPPGWVTFDSAWSTVSSFFAAQSRGPWTVAFAEGVAADAPWAPPISLWAFATPGVWDACAAQLAGISTLTFWNSSEYPYATGPTVYTSGAAPLWTFIFNGSATPTFVATWLLGQVVLNGILEPGNPCLGDYLFQQNPGNPIDVSVAADSNAVAAAAAAGSALTNPPGTIATPTPPSSVFAAYFPGPQLLPFYHGGSAQWSLAYGECGMAGQQDTNYTLTEYVLAATNPTPQGPSMWGVTSCFDSYYYLQLNRTTVQVLPAPTGLDREWSLNVSYLSSAVPARWSIWDLVASQLQFTLWPQGPPAPPINSSAAPCTAQDPTLDNCTMPTSGWYLVLLSPTGAWLDSYPTVANGTAWSIPNLEVVTGDRLLFVGSSTGIPSICNLETPWWGEPTVAGWAGITTT